MVHFDEEYGFQVDRCPDAAGFSGSFLDIEPISVIVEGYTSFLAGQNFYRFYLTDLTKCDLM